MSPDLHHLSGAYAVDALDDQERAAFEKHLAVCADCRAEVAELRASAHTLSALSEATPPPSLRASVLSGISQVRPLPPPDEDAGQPADPAGLPRVADPADTADAADADPTDAANATHRGGTVVPLRRRTSTWFAAAAAAAVIAVGGLAWSPWSNDAGAPSPVDQAAAAADAMRVSSTKGAVTAEVAYSRQLGRAAVSVTGLTPAPDGKAYQLWLLGSDGAASPAGLLTVDAEGRGEALLAGDASTASTVAMTLEPAGGSPQPTSDPLVVLSLI